MCWQKSEIRCQILRRRFSGICGNKCIRTNGTITEISGASSCNCVSQVEFAGDGCFERAVSRSSPLKRDTYAELPDGVEKGNIARGLLKPLYGVSAAGKDWRGTVRDFLARVLGVGVTSVG